MSKTIHIHIHGRTRDADGPAHAPAGSSKGGQFVSGGGGGGGGGEPSKEAAAVKKKMNTLAAKMSLDHPNHSSLSSGQKQKMLEQFYHLSQQLKKAETKK